MAVASFDAALLREQSTQDLRLAPLSGAVNAQDYEVLLLSDARIALLDIADIPGGAGQGINAAEVHPGPRPSSSAHTSAPPMRLRDRPNFVIGHAVLPNDALRSC
jgi:hypothetical protein